MCARGLEETVEPRDRCGSLGLMDREVTHEGHSLCCNKCFKIGTHIILDREATKKTKLYKVGKKWSRNPV